MLRERKVRTPESSVPDNVREGGFKAVRRKVPQRRYRCGRKSAVRVKRCGKSAPPGQRCRGQGKPHTEQDQIGSERSSQEDRACLLDAPQTPGRSLERRSNASPRGMIVPGPQGRGQNSAYRSACYCASPCLTAWRGIIIFELGATTFPSHSAFQSFLGPSVSFFLHTRSNDWSSPFLLPHRKLATLLMSIARAI
jgi:hypothetical protein